MTPEAALIDLQNIHDEGSLLVVGECGRHIPFPVRRMFAVTAVSPGERRGHHAHRQLNQMLICMSGSIDVVTDDGHERRTYRLDHLSRGLHVPPGIWAEQTYEGPGTVLLVLCDQPYDEADYIREYDQFLAYRGVTGKPT